jgi:hypothetical protein
MGLFSVPLVFGRRIKGMIRLRPEQMWMCKTMLHVHTCSGHDRFMPMMEWSNTNSTPNKSVILPSNQLMICYARTSPVHTVPSRCYDMP